MGISGGAVRGLIHRARTSMRSAAAAFMPPGLQAWLGRGSDAVPLLERSGEVTAGAGILGLTGALAKGAVVAATTGLLIAGGSAVRDSHQRSVDRQVPLQARSPTAVRSIATASPARPLSRAALPATASGRSLTAGRDRRSEAAQ